MNPNEPAFPVTYEGGTRSDEFGKTTPIIVTTTGLTKREYFAAMAMQSLISIRGTLYSSKDEVLESIRMADLLIQELSKEK